ncbi:LCP family protein [Microbacterium sp. NPDC089696]|uniref:LCP family protein n=1 Tax=Microbacterium sp. NPDC089696 TaxID=3364199 RepID=UPI0037F166A0
MRRPTTPPSVAADSPAPLPRRRRRRRVVALTAGVVVVGLVTTGVVAIAQLQGNVTTAPIRTTVSGQDEPAADKPATGAVNVLLLGSDARALDSDEFGDDDGTQRSDAMVLAHIAGDNSRIDAVQLPRDTLMDLPACEDTGRGSSRGGTGMLNSALNVGAACSVASVEKLAGVRIDHFVQMDFEGFIGMVDAIGGIDVCLPEPLQDGHARLDLPAGPQSVDGAQALALARTRHALAEESDIARLGHQQMVLSAIVQKATKSDVLVRPDRLYAFLDAATSSMTVDPGLGALTDLAALAARLATVPLSDVTFMTMPWEPAPRDRNRVVPAPDAAVVFQAIRDDVPIELTTDAPPVEESEPDAAVRTTPITVSNGAGVGGLAGRVADDARALGYTVQGLSNAERTETTVIVAGEDAEAQATAASLAADLGGGIEIRTGGSGVQVILGSDFPGRTAEVQVPPRPVDAVSRSADTDLCAS